MRGRRVKNVWELTGLNAVIRRGTYVKRYGSLAVGVSFLKDWGYSGGEYIVMRRVEDGSNIVYECDGVGGGEEEFVSAFRDGIVRKLYKLTPSSLGLVFPKWVWSSWGDIDWGKEEILFIFKRVEGKKFRFRVERVLRLKKNKKRD